MLRTLLAGLALALVAMVTPTLISVAAEPQPQVAEEVIREFVQYANSDEVYGEAYRTGNPDLLRQAWAGEALLDMSEDIAGMRALGQYLDLTLENMDFRRIEELGPGRVRAVTVEGWLARLYQTGGTPLGFQRQVVENRYLLERRGDAWYITEADQQIEGGDPTFRPSEIQ